MEFIIGIGTAIVAKLTEYTVASVIQVFHYPSNVDKLRARIQELNNGKDELQRRVDAAIRVGDEIVPEVRTWLSEASGKSQEAERFLRDECQLANNRCFGGSCPNLVSRHRLSKTAKTLAEDLASRIEAAGRINQVSTHPALQAPFQIEGDYKRFESRKKTLEGIMDALRDPEVSRIGVYGMGGVGKTMLAEEVAREATEEKLFSEVAMTTVSQTPNLERIQDDIAEKLKNFGLDKANSEHERAHRLLNRLKEEKKMLIILDDIWKELDLKKVGIHFEQDQKGCKILLTSRYLDCVRSSMDAEKYFQVEVLSPDEATDLFNLNVGNTVFERPDLQPLATKIIEECGRLPLAITTVAKALKHKQLARWEDALQQLQSSMLTNIEGMSEKVYKSIRLSFDFLEITEDEKRFLLLCSLHEEDRSIAVEDLRRYCVGWGLFPNIHKLEGARTSVDALVQKLKDHSLLLDGNRPGTVKMHDVIRDVAILIASEDKWKMRCIMGDVLEDCIRRNKPNKLVAISVLEGYKITARLPERLECPELELLLIRRVYSGYIPDDFFVETKKLKAIALGFSRIRSLPQSFFLLQNLQTLCLRNCYKLKDVGFIGDLKNLKILDLARTSIKQLPRKIGELTNLQLLDLRGCRKLEVIEPNAISNLTRLEELYMAEEFEGWEVEEDGIDERRNVSLVELKNLQQLMVLHLRVPDAKAFPKQYFFSEKLERYRISVGGRYPSTRDGISRALYLSLNQRSQLNALGLELLMKRSEHLCLSGFRDINNFVYDLDKEGFRRLKHLVFCDNDGVQYITNSMHQIHSSSVFLSLEILDLCRLTNLERICQGKFTADSFNNLRKVNVRNCGRLKNLFPLSIVKRLRDIEVRQCEMMEEIVTTEREYDDHSMSNEAADEVEFSELQKLRLSNLPNYVQFCSCEVEETCGSSSTDSDPKPLFRKKVSFPNLDYLDLNGVNVEKLWPEELLANSYMQNLTSLKIISCNSLKYLFSFSVTERLVNLKRVEVRDCMAMEDFLVTNREEGTHLEIIVHVFPKLEELQLDRLLTLKRLCLADSCFEFPSLFQLYMKSCPKLKTFAMPIQVSIGAEVNMPFFNDKVSFPNLDYLDLNGVNVEKLWSEELLANSYMQNLTKLRFGSCNSLKYLFSFAITEGLVNLERLEVYNCMVMDDILVTKRDGNHSGNYVFPKLKHLILHGLPSLKRFCVEDSCIKFSSLLELRIKNCPELKTFVMPIQVSIDNKEVNLPLFIYEKVSCPNLENLCLSGMNVEKLWPDELQANSHMQNLTSLKIESCNSLKYMFSFSVTVTERLVNLKHVEVRDCMAMEDFLVTNREEGIRLENTIYVFPKLEELKLDRLPALKRLCPADSCFEFPSLFQLHIESCPKLNTIVMPIQVPIDADVNMPLFNDKVICPSLKQLTCFAGLEAVYEIFDMTQSSIMSAFCNLEVLRVSYKSHHKPIALSYFKFFQKYPNIETLELRGFFVDGILCQQQPDGGPREQDGTYKHVSTRLKELQLINAPMLRHLFGDPETLERLTVWRCSRLQSFALSFMSFQNLKRLRVSGCHGLTYLFASSTAATLVQLQYMSIDDCKRMTEIINGDYYTEGPTRESPYHEFVFRRLWRLEIGDLPSLKSFYSGNKVISFPRLFALYIQRCPEMRSFSHGIVSSSESLNKIWVEDKKLWDGDVNTTVRRIWEDSSNLELEHLFAPETDVDQNCEENAA